MSDMSLIAALLGTAAGQCGEVIIAHGNLLAGLFFAGLLGSVSHCVGMCGPFVLGQVVARLDAVPAARMREWHRLAGAALVPYHLGRATTYAGLGGLAGWLASSMIDLSGVRWLPSLLLALAAVFLVVYGLGRLAGGIALPRLPGLPVIGAAFERLIRPLFARPTGVRGYALGLALGFLPCGLLYGAVSAAAASGTALAGVFAMLAFTAGTVPSLVAVGIAGHVAGDRWRPVARRLAGPLLLANGVFLAYLAVTTAA